MLVTGYRADTDQLVAQLVAEGADAVQYKPFQIPELIETLGKLVLAVQNKGEGRIHELRARRRQAISW